MANNWLIQESPGLNPNIEQENFVILCEWLESEAEIYLVSEIYSKMIELGRENNDVYTKQWPKTKL